MPTWELVRSRATADEVYFDLEFKNECETILADMFLEKKTLFVL
jgi:hypothetical protein